MKPDLVEDCKSFNDFISKIKKITKKGFWIFRGQKEFDQDLATTLERSYIRFRVVGRDKIRVENNMIREFQRRFHYYTSNIPPDKESSDEWLALMQHYGAPTRFLDFTYSPYVAAYFAFEKADADSKVSIWAFNTEWCRNELKKIHKTKFSAALKYRKTRKSEYFNKVFMPKNKRNIEKFVYAVNPFRLNERLTYQKGVFLCPGDVTTGFMDNLLAYDNKQLKNNVIKFNIETGKNNKNTIEVLKFLDQMNINRSTLFPDLDGFAQSFAPRIHTIFIIQP